jgi:two-component system, cell cycle sensor histidine kinase and response regulator CckA
MPDRSRSSRRPPTGARSPNQPPPEDAARALSLLEATLESTADGILVVDREGRVTRYNQRFLELWRIPGDLAAAGSDERLLAFVLEQLKDPDAFLAKVKELYAHPEASSVDALDFTDGRVFERYSRPQRVGAEVVGRVWCFRDVSERRRAERLLAASEARLRTMVDSTPECVKLLARDGILVDMNPAGLRMIEADSLAQVAGQSVLPLIAPEHRDAYAELIRRVFQGRAGTLEFDIVGLKGTRRSLETHAVPLRDDQGDVTGMLCVTRDVTERHRAEAARRQSEERYRAFISNSGEAIWRVELGEPIPVELPPEEQVARIFRHGRLAECNEVMARAHGAPSAAEFAGARIADFLLPADARNAAYLHAFVTGGYRQTEAESFERDRAGRPKVFLNNLVGIVEAGRLVRIWGTQRDITDRKKAEQVQAATYRISEAANTVRKLNDLYRSIHEIVSELIPARNFYVALHDAAEQVISFPYFVDEYDAQYPPKRFGRGLTEYVIRTGRPLLATPDVYADLERRGEVELIGAPSLDWMGVPLRAGDEIIGVLVVQTYSEGVRYGEVELSILQFVSDQVARAFERQRAAVRLAEVASRYQQLFDANPEAMWVYDLETQRFLAVNAAAVARYGYAVDEFVAMTIADIRPPGEAADLQTLLLGRQESSGSGLGRHRKKDGTIIDVEVTSHALTFDGRPARIVLARDVTERRRLEEQLRQAQKMEAVGRLAGGIAHDFNNLLTAILGTSQLLLRDLTPEATAREDVEEIRKAALRAADLTRQLLAYSRRQVLAPKVLDLNAIISNLDAMLRRLIGEDVHLVTELAPPLSPVRADPSQIEQVILNLVVNARDAMPAGGRLTIRTADLQLAGTEATTGQAPTPGSYVILEVADTGTGMTAEVKAHLFEPFFTTKEVGKGTGLGLATVYGVVKQSGGYIWVTSEVDRGTTVRIAIPAAQSAALPAEPPAPPRAPVRAGETILLVEDEEAVRRIAARTLTADGYRVLTAKDGPDALEVAAREAGTIHLLLTDVVMPGMTGRELAERVAATRPDARVLFMSGYTEDPAVRRIMTGDGHAYLQKPFEPDVLGRKVRAVLDGLPAER